MLSSVLSYRLSIIAFLLVAICSCSTAALPESATSLPGTPTARNDTAPEYLSWYSAPNLRGTTDILWSCVTTLITTTWAAVFLNVPGPDESEMRRTARKVKWMVIGLIAPEYLVMMAFIQNRDARRCRKEMRKRGYKDWTLMQSFYVNMGGIVLDVADRNESDFYIKIGGIAMNVAGRRRFPVTYQQFLALLDTGTFKIPDITEKDIKDRNKTDHYAVVVACMQASWLVVQCIGRKVQHLPISALELTTTVFILNALLVYSLWWNKPLNVQVPIVVCVESKTDEELHAWIGMENSKRTGIFTSKKDVITVDRVFNASDFESGDYFGAIHAIAVITMLYGALHCLAWNFSFPTAVERTLWRISSVATIVALPAVGIFGLPLLALKDAKWRCAPYLRDSIRLFPCMLICLYPLCRAYLLVESFVELRFLPAGVYETVQWSNFLPHV